MDEIAVTEIEFEIPYLPKTPNSLLRQSRWHVKKEKDVVHRMISLVCPRIKKPWQKAKLILVRESSQSLDFDGLVSSFKYVVDSIVKQGLMVDDSFEVTGNWEVSWRKAKPKKGRIFVKILKVE